MLIEFRVKNFRSLRDEQVLSLVASKDKTLLETNTSESHLSAAPYLLRSAAIYGANASGKSNLIKALQYMRGVVLDSISDVLPGQKFSAKPFLLDARSTIQPIEFEVTFLQGGIRYQYGFTLNEERINHEYLLVYKAFKPQLWFDRQYDEKTRTEKYKFGSNLKGAKSLWEGATRQNALFLSTAVKFNSSDLLPIFNWFANHLIIFNEHARLNQAFAIQMLEQENGRKEMCRFLSSADISISDIELKKRKIQGNSFHFDMLAQKTEVRTEEIEEYQLHFHHTTKQGSAVFDIQDESNGTRNLLFLGGPILDILKKGLTLVIDEIDTSLHPLLVQDLVRRFHNQSKETGVAQLIFTTHDTSLMSAPHLLRRDQIWFINKDQDQASFLAPLSDFSPRKNEALERGYLMGRYGGIPFLDSNVGEE